MQRIVTSLCAVLVVSPIANPASAQKPPPRPVATMFGNIHDTSSIHYPRKYSVCTWVPNGSSYYMLCARTDTTGSYRLENIPLIGLRIAVGCETLRGFGKVVASDTLVFRDTAVLRHDWIVSSAGCDLRPLRQVSRIFTGHYTPGFESSKFIPCANDAWFVPTDSLDLYPYDAKEAWVTWRDAANQQVKWPDAPRDEYKNPTYYVRWRGTLVGPGRYGHLGVSPFQFFVDSVLLLRAPTKNDCR